MWLAKEDDLSPCLLPSRTEFILLEIRTQLLERIGSIGDRIVPSDPVPQPSSCRRACQRSAQGIIQGYNFPVCGKRSFEQTKIFLDSFPVWQGKAL